MRTHDFALSAMNSVPACSVRTAAGAGSVGVCVCTLRRAKKQLSARNSIYVEPNFAN